MYERIMVDATFHCKHCQSWPDCYTCSHPDSFRRKPGSGEMVVRECMFGQMWRWDPRWYLHPCALFEGTITLDAEDKTLIVRKSGAIVQEQNAEEEKRLPRV